jgi:hypothetical protein
MFFQLRVWQAYLLSCENIWFGLAGVLVLSGTKICANMESGLVWQADLCKYEQWFGLEGLSV